MVAVAHPDGLGRGEPAEHPRAQVAADLRQPVLGGGAGADLASQRLGNQLVAEAQAKDRSGWLLEREVEPGHAVRTDDRVRSARQDEADDLWMVLEAERVRYEQLAVDPERPDAPGDQVRVLATEIEDGDAFHSGVDHSCLRNSSASVSL